MEEQEKKQKQKKHAFMLANPTTELDLKHYKRFKLEFQAWLAVIWVFFCIK